MIDYKRSWIAYISCPKSLGSFYQVKGRPVKPPPITQMPLLYPSLVAGNFVSPLLRQYIMSLDGFDVSGVSGLAVTLS